MTFLQGMYYGTIDTPFDRTCLFKCHLNMYSSKILKGYIRTVWYKTSAQSCLRSNFKGNSTTFINQ